MQLSSLFIYYLFKIHDSRSKGHLNCREYTKIHIYTIEKSTKDKRERNSINAACCVSRRNTKKLTNVSSWWLFVII